MRGQQQPPLAGELTVLSSILACYAVLLSKCAATLLITSVNSKCQLDHWQFWAYLAAMAAFATCQVHTLNLALRTSAAVWVLPVFESLTMTGEVILCGVFFGEFRAFTAQDAIFFACGMACVLCGIAVLLQARVTDSCNQAASVL